MTQVELEEALTAYSKNHWASYPQVRPGVEHSQPHGSGNDSNQMKRQTVSGGECVFQEGRSIYYTEPNLAAGEMLEGSSIRQATEKDHNDNRRRQKKIARVLDVSELQALESKSTSAGRLSYQLTHVECRPTEELVSLRAQCSECLARLDAELERRGEAISRPRH